MRPSRFFLWCLAATVVLTILAVVLALSFPLIMPGPDELIGPGIIIFLYFVASLVCAVASERGRLPRLMYSGIYVGLLAVIGWLIAMLTQRIFPSVRFEKIMIWPTMWTGFMLLVAVLMLPHARGWPAAISSAITIVLGATLALAIALMLSFYPDQYDPDFEQAAQQIITSLALLCAGGFVISFLMLWLPMFNDQQPRPAVPLPYWLQCPRCGRQQQAITGAYHCEHCRLQVRVEVA